MNQKAMVAMSGGVDSAVAALLVRDAGYDTAGLTMRLWDGKKSQDDINTADARAVADHLQIPHHTVSLDEDFYRHVVMPFIDEYVAGRTPNPCVICNRDIKFGSLLKAAKALGYDRMATGHYARVERNENGRFLLKKARDESKDQSYFLWTLTQDVLSSVLFPLGNYTKAEIRAIAATHELASAHRSDSQDICFIPNGDYIAFIESKTRQTFPKGKFVDTNGIVLGEHEGLIRYTIGQRKGLGIALGEPMFVKEKNPLDNTVTLCRNDALFSQELTATDINLISCDTIPAPVRLQAKIRYRHAPAEAVVEQIDDKRLSVRFDIPQRAIAPGQSLVLYDGDTVVGGGIIA